MNVYIIVRVMLTFMTLWTTNTATASQGREALAQEKKKAALIAGQANCTICLDDFSAAKPSIVLQCNHKYCFTCLSKSVAYNNQCNMRCQQRPFTYPDKETAAVCRWFALLGKQNAHIDQLRNPLEPVDEFAQRGMSEQAMSNLEAACQAAAGAAGSGAGHANGNDHVDVKKVVCKDCGLQAKCPGCKNSFFKHDKKSGMTSTTQALVLPCGHRYCMPCVKSDQVLMWPTRFAFKSTLCRVCKKECPEETRKLMANLGAPLLAYCTAAQQLKGIASDSVLAQRDIHVDQLALKKADVNNGSAALACSTCDQQVRCSSCSSLYNICGLSSELRSITLRCGHNYCLYCADMLGKSPRPACSLCRTQVPLADKESLASFFKAYEHKKRSNEVRLQEILAAMLPYDEYQRVQSLEESNDKMLKQMEELYKQLNDTKALDGDLLKQQQQSEAVQQSLVLQQQLAQFKQQAPPESLPEDSQRFVQRIAQKAFNKLDRRLVITSLIMGGIAKALPNRIPLTLRVLVATSPVIAATLPQANRFNVPPMVRHITGKTDTEKALALMRLWLKRPTVLRGILCVSVGCARGFIDKGHQTTLKDAVHNQKAAIVLWGMWEFFGRLLHRASL